MSLKAIILNTSLKPKDEDSNTEGLAKEVMDVC